MNVMNRVEVPEMWCYRWMLTVMMTMHITEDLVLWIHVCVKTLVHMHIYTSRGKKLNTLLLQNSLAEVDLKIHFTTFP